MLCVSELDELFGTDRQINKDMQFNTVIIIIIIIINNNKVIIIIMSVLPKGWFLTASARA